MSQLFVWQKAVYNRLQLYPLYCHPINRDYHNNNRDEDEQKKDDEDCCVALSCSFRNLCISSGLPAIELFLKSYFHNLLNDHEHSNCAKPCSKDGKICRKAPECRSRHNAASIVIRRLRTSEKRDQNDKKFKTTRKTN